MLNAIKKVFSNTNEEDIEMSKKDEQPQLAAMNMAELVASLATQAEAFSALEASFAELSGKYEGAVAALAAHNEEKLALVAQAAAAKLQARKESLEMAVGTEKAATLLGTLEVLDDVGFAAVVSSMSMNLDKEANTASFKEVGVSANADATKVVEETSLEAALKSKYQAK